jgi:Ca-activated chloride channel homolog
MPVTSEDLKPGAYLPRSTASGQPLQLAMQELMLTGRILPVGAQLLVSHRFRSAEQNMLEVIYSFALPRDAALRRFEVRGREFAVRSALKPVKEASEAYEEGLAQGHLSTLARQYRDGIVNLSLGNLRPEEDVTVLLEIIAGVDLRDDGVRFRFPFTLAPAYHSGARAAETSPGVGEIELPADLFGDVVLPRFHESAENLHRIFFDLEIETPWDIEEISSPSHSVRFNRHNRVSLAPESDLPDRDLVLDLKIPQKAFHALSGRGEDGRRHFAVVVPSTTFGAVTEAPRTVVILLDRSGSMSGIPIAQARKAAAACLSALGPEDRFGLIAFDDQCELFRPELSNATPETLGAAREFLDGINSRGGTELASGVKQATDLLRRSGGDVLILTDGQVFGTEEILGAARATGCRLHSLGIGSASQDRFLALLSRETQGISRFVTPRERVDGAALELFASVSRPIASDVKVSKLNPAGTSVSPDPAPSVFQGTPVIVFGDWDALAAASVTIEFHVGGKTGSLEVPIGSEENACGETLRLVRGSRLITDAEARLGEVDVESKRESKRREEYLTRLSEQYSLAGRTMALVAVVERQGDKPGEPPKTRIVPVGLPQDTNLSGIFPQPALAAPRASARMLCRIVPPRTAPSISSFAQCDSILADPACELSITYTAESAAEPPAAFDELLDLSIRVQPDGGMPGKSAKDRILASVLTLLAFAAHGSDLLSGSFRVHFKKLLDYLSATLPDSLTDEESNAVRAACDSVAVGRSVPGNWLNLATLVVNGDAKAAGRAWKALLKK